MSTNDYVVLHESAMRSTVISAGHSAKRRGNAHEIAIVALYKAWRMYAEAHSENIGCQIGDDYVLGGPWLDIGKALISLLNGETGARLDCGTMDGAIRVLMVANGFSQAQADGEV